MAANVIKPSDIPVLVAKAAGGLTAGATIVRYVIMPVVRRVRKFIKLIRELEQQHDAMGELLTRLPMGDALTKLSAQIAKIGHELHPNSGLSLRDAIQRIELSSARAEERSKILLGMSQDALFESDPQGRLTFVNRTFVRWTGRMSDDLQGDGWINVVWERDREMVIREWRDCIASRRVFECRYHLLDHDDDKFPVTCRAFPMVYDFDNTVLGYVGRIVRDVRDVKTTHQQPANDSDDALDPHHGDLR